MERCEVPKEPDDVRPLGEGALQHLHALPGWVGFAVRGPSVGERAGAAVALADQRDRLLGAEQRRG